jgi:hypothetical protein
VKRDHQFLKEEGTFNLSRREKKRKVSPNAKQNHEFLKDEGNLIQNRRKKSLPRTTNRPTDGGRLWNDNPEPTATQALA